MHASPVFFSLTCFQLFYCIIYICMYVCRLNFDTKLTAWSKCLFPEVPGIEMDIRYIKEKSLAGGESQKQPKDKEKKEP